MRYQAESSVFMMGSEVDLAVESILNNDCSTDLVDVDVPEQHSNFLVSDLIYQQQRKTPPQQTIPRNSFSPSSLDEHDSADFVLPISKNDDVLRTPVTNVADTKNQANNSINCFQLQMPMTSSSNDVCMMAPNSCKPVDNIDDSKDIVHSISEDLIEEAILGVVFDFHRAAKCGLMFLLNKAAQNADKYKIVDEFRTLNNNVTDVFGQALSGGRSSKLIQQVDCYCPECNQPTAACRFAPHLEKCMGMGRSSFRKARTRLAASNVSSAASSQQHFGGTVLKNSSAKTSGYGRNNNVVAAKNSWSDNDDVDDDDDEWISGSSNSRKKTQQRKRLVPKSSNKKRVRNTPVKKKQSSPFMLSSQSSSILANQLSDDSNSNAAILLSDLLDTPPLYVTGDDKSNRSRDSPMFTIGESRRCQKLPDEDDDYLDFDVPSPSL